MSTAGTSAPTRFHLSLNVGNLSRSVEFLEALLGVPPAKLRDDYAKFEIDDPPLVLSLEPRGVSAGGVLNHVGFRLPDSSALVEAQRRLEAAGISTQREEGVECCYARQSKFWVHDPDHTLWEIYVFEGDIDHRGAGQSAEAVGLVPLTIAAREHDTAAPARQATLFHRLGQPFRDTPADEVESVDEALLQGTFNDSLNAAERTRILREVYRALRPGGQVLFHVLTGSHPLSAAPELPGLAAVVRQVPVDREILSEIEAAGLVGVYMAKFGESPCFHAEGVELRETKIVAFKPRPGGEANRSVLYKGPFREVSDDAGHTFRRGRRMPVDDGTWNTLKAGPAVEHFLFLPTAQSGADELDK